MIKKNFFGVCFLFAISGISSVFADTHHKTITSKHTQELSKNITRTTEKSVLADPQLNFYSAHQDKNNYVIALYTNRPGKALITYDSPTCQANSYGDTIIDSKNKSQIEFTSTEDPLCKITLKKENDNQLKIIKETPACTAWHGDFCSFSSLSPLTRIYPH
ncbi:MULTISPECIES: hypothetical protein [Commensalibacter]|uniref:Uncharacterized protein n=2 Tax=Commensalibacter TaxID=1079922 RepID=W7DTT7_9PROT|nr:MULTISPECIES: hypothetical protein [Commensalibacter]EUK18410.1 hypothetical protein COMX_01640 [Commensalibacter papalotli (ex Servin-Garciduenas et al. 2014)]CAI3934175.1 unnamed protein product [Commensalibacter papalotli (ex Botero et al. 2024)]CAI3941534.1 unnamed protein product [Commensalibacter papalotli (ex Botero et al. 2024)]